MQRSIDTLSVDHECLKSLMLLDEHDLVKQPSLPAASAVFYRRHRHISPEGKRLA
jgi:hypothetical protein